MKKGLVEGHLLEILIFAVGLIVVVGASVLLVRNLENISDLSVVRTKVELAARTKELALGATVGPANFQCNTKREYLVEKDFVKLTDKIKKRTYDVWYAYGEGKIDFVSDWADEYFTYVENPACYVCYIVSNSEEFDKDENWNKFLVGKNNKYWEKDELFRPFYYYDPERKVEFLTGEYDPQLAKSILLNGNGFIFPIKRLEIGPDEPIFIGVSILKVNPDIIDLLLPGVSLLRVTTEGITYPLFSRIKKSQFTLIPFAMNQDSVNEFCKKEIFIDV